MEELVFQTQKDIGKIEREFQEFNLFEKLKQALEEALNYEKNSKISVRRGEPCMKGSQKQS